MKSPVCTIVPAGVWIASATQSGATLFKSPAVYDNGRATLVGSKNDPGPAERERPSYELFDLGGSWRIAEAFELRLFLRNLTDEFYIAAADELAAPSPGRTIQLGISGRF